MCIDQLARLNLVKALKKQLNLLAQEALLFPKIKMMYPHFYLIPNKKMYFKFKITLKIIKFMEKRY
jgi:hypothetical protein